MTQSDRSDAKSVTPAAAPTPEDADLITRNLRSLFKSVEDEPLPENLQALLARLGETEGPK